MSEKPYEPVLGIDLGSANSACAIYKNGVPIPIPNEIGVKTTPSVVSFRSSDKKDWEVGNSAYEGLGLEYEYNVSYVKRIIGLNKDDETLKKNLDNKEIFPFGYKFDEKDRVKIIIKTPKKFEDYGKKIENLSKDKVQELEFYPEEISALVLKKLKENAEKYINKEIKKAVITVPAYFHENQREATKNAGKIAGLDVVNMINEPTSAALAYGIKIENNTSENYLVFDLGAGTFDVTILKISNKNNEIEFNVIGTSGENALGERDFDKKMIKHINEIIKKSLNEKKNNSKDSDLSKEEKEKLKKAEEILSENIKLDEFDYYNDFNLNNRIKLACEMAKIRLSYNNEAIIPLDTISLVCNKEVKITKKQFEDWNEELFEKCMTVIKNLLAERKMDKSKIKNVILIGGASRMPKMQEKIKDYFGLKELLFKIDPEEAVCLGAAIQGAITNRQIDTKIKDINLYDVIPFNYGIEVQGGKMDVIIKKYSHIPIIEKKIFRAPKTADIAIKIYEGNYEMAKDNILIKKIKIHIEENGIIKVIFEIDDNSILSVRATNEDETEEREIFLTNEKSFTREEIENLKLKGEISNNYLIIPKQLNNLKKKYLESKNDDKTKFDTLYEYIKSYEKYIKGLKVDNFEKNKGNLYKYTTFLSDLINQYSILLNYKDYIKNLKEDFVKHCKEFLGECFTKIVNIPNLTIYQYIQSLKIDENEYKKEIFSFCVLFVAENNVLKLKNHFNKNEIFYAKNYCHEVLRKLAMYSTKKYLLDDYKDRYKKVIDETKKYSIGVKVKNFVDIGFKLFKKSVKYDEYKITNFQYFQDAIFFFNQAEKLINDIKYSYEAGPEEWTNILKGQSMINFYKFKTKRITKEVYEKNDNKIQNQLKDYNKTDLNLSTIRDIDNLYDNCKSRKNYKPFYENIINNLPSNEGKKIDINLNECQKNEIDALYKFRKYLNPKHWANSTEEEKEKLKKVTRYSAYINNILQKFEE